MQTQHADGRTNPQTSRIFQQRILLCLGLAALAQKAQTIMACEVNLKVLHPQSATPQIR